MPARGSLPVKELVPAAAQHGNSGKPYQTETAADQKASDAAGLPSPELLRQLLDYEPETGSLTWKLRPAEMFTTADAAKAWNARFAGKPAGTENGKGYMQIGVLGRICKAHRVCWAIFHGEWPTDQIDHENGNRSDNRIRNLRDVTCAENLRNQKRRICSPTEQIGVVWRAREEKWRAQIKVGNRDVHLGYFTDFDAAVAARKAAEREFGFHPNHGRSA